MNTKLTIDVRMSKSSGIGVYLTSLLPYLAHRFQTTFYDSFVAIYSLQEQIDLFYFRDKGKIFWSPHYNVPLLPIKSKKRLVTIHDVYHLAYYGTLSLKQKIYAKVMLNAAVRLSEKVITVSDFSRAEIIRHTKCRPEKIKVIKNGTRQQPVVKDAGEIQFKYGLPQRYILFVGNVKPHKNLRKLIEAYLHLDEQDRAELSIVIVGKKDGFITGDAGLMDFIGQNKLLEGRVYFTGFVDDDDLDTIYRGAQLFVFPSYYEGFGLPPLEAMLNACPVISSDAASMPEVCGDAALYFNPGDAAALAGRIKEVLGNPALRQQLIESGLERVKLFTWERSAREHIELINTLLES